MGDEETFDIAPTVPMAPVKKPPANLLTRDKVKVVGFHKAVKGKGYVYSQVDTFVELVENTLEYLENALHDKDMAVYHAQEENNDLLERNSVLQATIEIFRANGDPIRTEDGDYLTESQIIGNGSDARDHEILALRAERDALAEDLTRAKAEAEAGWSAEADLRKYLEEIQPWIQALEKSEFADSVQKEAPAKETLNQEVSTPQETNTPSVLPAPVPDTSVFDDEIIQETHVPEEDTTVLAPTTIAPTVFGQDKTDSEDDGWGDETVDEPVAFPTQPSPKAVPAVAPSTQEQTDPPKVKKRRKDILLSAPEAAHLLSDGSADIKLIGEDDPLEATPVDQNGTPFLSTAPEVIALEGNKP
jgi:hypothetical protein